jgi:hypothetical protein
MEIFGRSELILISSSLSLQDISLEQVVKALSIGMVVFWGFEG